MPATPPYFPPETYNGHVARYKTDDNGVVTGFIKPNSNDEIVECVVTATTDPATGGSSFSAGGIPINVSARNRIPAVQVDVFDLYRLTERRQLSLPNPYSAVGPDMAHPSVVFIPSGWRNWRFWMAYTPYPTANSNYENPCIAVSNDGDNWETPDGLTNPLVQKPTNGYNADTHLFMAPDYSKIYLAYRERITSTYNSVKVMESVDGVTWSAPVTILQGTYGSQDYASPSIWYDSANARWSCISHNLDGGATYPMQLNKTSGSNVYTGWGANQAITMANPTGGRTWWHSAFNSLPDGRVVGLVQDIVNSGGGAPGALFAAESLDGGLTFAVRSVYSELKFYRTNFTAFELDNGQVGIHAWIGRQDSGPSFTIHREDWVIGAVDKTIKDGILSSPSYGTYPASWLFWDNFNRADGALGSPLVGSALTVDVGTWAIVSNRAQSGSAGNNRALATLGSADHVVECSIVLNPTSTWLIFRAVDTSNFYRVGFSGAWPSSLVIQSIVAGAVGALNRNVITPKKSATTAAAKLRVVCRGRRFRIYLDDEFCEEITDSLYYATGVKAGIQATNAAAAFDNLLIMA